MTDQVINYATADFYTDPGLIDDPHSYFDFLRQQGVKLLAVDDPIEVRYARIQKRKNSTDNVSLEEFILQEQKESVGTLEWDMNIPACVKEADYIFSDNGDFDSFRDKVHHWVGQHLSEKQ